MKKILIIGVLLIFILVAYIKISEYKETKENNQVSLYQSIKSNDIENVKKLLPQVSEVRDSDIAMSIEINNVDILKLLLNSKKVKADNYRLPLRIATIFSHNIEMVKLLLDSDETIEVPCELLEELSGLSLPNDTKIMELLLDRWFRLGNNLENCGEKLFFNAIEIGNKGIIDLLVKKGVKTDSLQAAIALGKKEEVEKYLKESEDKKSTSPLTSQPNTPVRSQTKMPKPNTIYTHVDTSDLYLAVVNNQVEIAKLLLKYGANVDDGKTTSTYATGPILAGGNTIVEYPLIVAVARGYKEIAKLLLENGANVNYEDINGNTALDYVTGEAEKQIRNKYGTNIKFPKDEEMERLLLKYGAKEGSHTSHMMPIY